VTHRAEELPPPNAYVRLTDDAVADLERLARKDPQIVRWCVKKMLLLERSPLAGEPLLGDLIGFRKLVVGDRSWRIVWRVLSDEAGAVVIDIAEVWAAGARADAEVYEEVRRRMKDLGAEAAPRPLADVLPALGRLFDDLGAAVEPVAAPAPGTPEWLVERVVKTVGLDRAEVASMTPDEAMSVLENHWSTR
jgi:mRNA interferase RelE/StbE